jgi:hypothetical protein
VKDATTDPSQIKVWWQQWPDANVGIATGPESGLVVLDIDVDVDKGIDGEASLRELEAGHGDLPSTIKAETGRGGWHILFQYPQDRPVKNSAGKVGAGIDVRGDGGYIVAPPSMHPNGNRYKWSTGHSPNDVDLAPVPEWLLALTGKASMTTAASKNAARKKLNGSKIQEGARNDALYRLGCSMRAKGFAEPAIQAALKEENRVSCDPPLDEDEVNQIALSVTNYDPGKDSIDDSRPQIRMVDGQIDRVVRETEQAILKSPDMEIYQFADRLVRPIRQGTRQTDDGITRDLGAVTLHQVVPPWLVVELTKAITWLRWDGRKDDWRPVDCPSNVATGYLAQAGNWRVPRLKGIVEAPTLRRDGSVLAKPGYDQATSLLFDPQGAEFPAVPGDPSIEDANEALAKLKGVIADFPFVSDAHESAALAAILTALVRRSLRSAPMFGFTAPLRGSGKSLLADVVSLIATGRDAAVMSQARSSEEDKKRLLSILLHGDPIVVIDNVERDIFGDALCSILTQSTYQDRVLGENTMVSVPTNAMFIATGNNLTFRGDMLTRALLARIDPRCEHPEERKFAGDLRQHVREHRGELVCAILTILRAYHVAGCPDQGLKPFGRFEEWSNLVRSTLVWLGEADPCITREEIEMEDPDRRGLETLLEAWFAAYADGPLTITEALEDVEVNKDNALIKAVGQALSEVAGDRGGKPSAKRIAWYFRQKANKIVNGRKIEKAGNNGHKVAQWRVTYVHEVEGTTQSGLSGLSGFVSSRPGENAAECDPGLTPDTNKRRGFFGDQPRSKPDKPDNPDKKPSRSDVHEKVRRLFDPSTPEGQCYLAGRRRNVLEARAHKEELERKRRRLRTNHSSSEEYSEARRTMTPMGRRIKLNAAKRDLDRFLEDPSCDDERAIAEQFRECGEPIPPVMLKGFLRCLDMYTGGLVYEMDTWGANRVVVLR